MTRILSTVALLAALAAYLMAGWWFAREWAQ